MFFCKVEKEGEHLTFHSKKFYKKGQLKQYSGTFIFYHLNFKIEDLSKKSYVETFKFIISNRYTCI